MAAAPSDSSQPGDDRDNPSNPDPNTNVNPSLLAGIASPGGLVQEQYVESPSGLDDASPTDSQAALPANLSSYSTATTGTSPPPRSKRRQVKNACTNCQKACKKCDDARPCMRCVKYGVAEDCIDSQRKERKKGVKRGPYKKRDGKGIVNPPHSPMHGIPQAVASGSMPAQAMPPITYAYPGTMPYIGPPPGYPPGFYPQFPPNSPRPGEIGMYYPHPQWYYAPGHQPSMMGPPHLPYYPTAFMPQPYANYMMPHPPPEN